MTKEVSSGMNDDKEMLIQFFQDYNTGQTINQYLFIQSININLILDKSQN
jgi:hypothetical protein